MIESALVALFWTVLGFGIGLAVGAEIVKCTTKPVQVVVSDDLLRGYIEHHGYVVMPKGPEWPPAPKAQQ